MRIPAIRRADTGLAQTHIHPVNQHIHGKTCAAIAIEAGIDIQPDDKGAIVGQRPDFGLQRSARVCKTNLIVGWGARYLVDQPIRKICRSGLSEAAGNLLPSRRSCR